MNKIKSDKLVENVILDYQKRREQRRSLELQWQLNINFMMGNQYSYLAGNGEIREDEKQYFWQEKEVFNHIAPTIETRITKVCSNVPNVTVVPASGDEGDIQSAKLSKQILKSVENRLNLPDIEKTASTWSEICGSSFYKVVWNTEAGNMLAFDEFGKKIKEGDVSVEVVTPFEIFPDNLSCERLEDLNSLIYARAVDVNEVKRMYNVEVEAEDVNSFTLNSEINNLGGLGYNAHINKVSNVKLKDCCVVIERYEKPTKDNPNGRLTIVAGDKLLFDGELPYLNDEMNGRTFPFIKQVSNYMPGSFFGVSVIDRMIPVQRAYNAVRNRKHEYFNRCVMNVMAVEDGSIDTEELEIEGLSPGKVLVYRQGSKVPELIKNPEISLDFAEEENRLLDEFKTISGVNDIGFDNNYTFSNMSGVALQLIADQGVSRLSTAIDSIKSAIKSVAKNILRLYKQFAVMPRLTKISGENGEVRMFYWDKNEICSDDVVFDSISELGENLVQRRTMLMDLIKEGLMYDKDGGFSTSMRKRCLDLLGFGMWDNTIDLDSLQINHAQEENILITNGEAIKIMPIDNHQIHIDEHIAYILGGTLKDKDKKEEIINQLLNHIAEHKKCLGNFKEEE